MSRRKRRKRKKTDHGFHKSRGISRLLRAKSSTARALQSLIGIAIAVFILGGVFAYANQWGPFARNRQEASSPIKSRGPARDEYESNMELLTDLRQSNDIQEPLLKIDRQRQRLDVAQEILEMQNLTDLGREIAVKAKLEAIGAYYGLDFMHEFNEPQLPQRALDIAEEYADDDIPTIAKEARLLTGKVQVFEYIKKPTDEQFDIVVRELVALAEKYPEDEYVHSSLRIMIEELSRRFPIQSYPLVDQISQTYRNSTNEKIADSMLRIRDTIMMHASQTELSASTNKPEFMRTKMVELASNPNTGDIVLNSLYRSTVWFEAMDMYDESRATNEALRDSVEKRTDPKLAERARQLSRDALRRLDSLGQPWDFFGTMSNGEPVDVSQFEGRATIILFWERRDRRAREAIEELSQAFTRLDSAKVAAIVVPTDELPTNPEDIVDPMSINNELLYVVSPDADPSHNPYVQQFPVPKPPYVVIIDTQGRIADIGVQFVKLYEDTMQVIRQSESK